MKMHFTLLVICIAWQFATAQEITLDQCYQNARSKSPVSGQFSILKEINDLSIKSLTNEKLPQFQINGQYTYQSDVVSFPDSPIFSGPDISKNQYKLSLDLNQSIFQGNRIKHQIEIENAQLTAETQRVEVSLNSIKKKINELYFAALSLQENSKIYETVILDLQNRLNQIHSLIENGVLRPADEKSIQIEIKKAQQEKASLEYQKLAVVRMLAEQTGLDIPESARLQVPNNAIPENLSIDRPEQKLYEYQGNLAEAQKSLSTLSRLPKLAAFGSVGIGEPNPMNFFETDLSSFYIIGARLSWTLWDWNNSSRSKQILELQKQKINREKENFELGINTQLAGATTNLEKLKELIIGDRDILNLQTEITREAFSRFKQGVVTATEYSSELNKETQAKLKVKIREIQISEAQIEILTITGNI